MLTMVRVQLAGDPECPGACSHQPGRKESPGLGLLYTSCLNVASGCAEVEGSPVLWFENMDPRAALLGVKSCSALHSVTSLYLSFLICNMEITS